MKPPLTNRSLDNGCNTGSSLIYFRLTSYVEMSLLYYSTCIVSLCRTVVLGLLLVHEDYTVYS